MARQGGYERLILDRGRGQHHGARADHSATTDSAATQHDCTGGHMGAGADRAVVLDHRSSVDDRTSPDHCAGLNHCASQYDGACAQARRWADMRLRVSDSRCAMTSAEIGVEQSKAPRELCRGHPADAYDDGHSDRHDFAIGGDMDGGQPIRRMWIDIRRYAAKRGHGSLCHGLRMSTRAYQEASHQGFSIRLL